MCKTPTILLAILVFGLFCSSAPAATKTLGKVTGDIACGKTYWQCTKDCGAGRLCSAYCDKQFRRCTGKLTTSGAIAKTGSGNKGTGKNMSGATGVRNNNPQTKGPTQRTKRSDESKQRLRAN